MRRSSLALALTLALSSPLAAGEAPPPDEARAVGGAGAPASVGPVSVEPLPPALYALYPLPSGATAREAAEIRRRNVELARVNVAHLANYVEQATAHARRVQAEGNAEEAERVYALVVDYKRFLERAREILRELEPAPPFGPRGQPPAAKGVRAGVRALQGLRERLAPMLGGGAFDGVGR